MSDTNIEEEKRAAVEDTLRRLYGFWAERAAKHRSTANLVEFLHEGPEDDALELEEVELAPKLRAKMKELLREFKDCFAWDYTEMPRLSRDLVEHRLPTMEDFKSLSSIPAECQRK
ncbi:hypothetical protein L3X38_036772 [Prunus dulcis]|uniref:Uncharacterized protein n=1 Tax=Prunus dulcis TaxID=3755 RepID=A0AAD4YQ00_PRUDU|nr:hypothetical protein L3X38_036772 [Prunus dulcis]